MAAAIKKVNMITQIVRLRQVVQRWKTKSLSRHSLSSSSSDSDESGGSPKCRTPSGSLAVYVGPERSRFVIPTRFLNFPVFVTLLDQAEEEFGFQTTGGLVLPCEPGFFSEILSFLDDDEERFRGLSLDEFINIVTDVSSDHLSCKESSSSFAFAPLLHKTRV
ncbi:protein SMALL AUXIN UP-REGULATED RNA 51-like [Salvia miltiorrhiza]|uniref:protein SMALL AUXIN UP-REGULATED RNA 51-like n=1 Tax=Salvia miltiorrhiza TaxID=226208 RepID=UPI0025ACB54A|nr:protein SMALL AUXIN UP-REGULATED RNA 51-like [Salvia miltiorrhiza]